MQFGKAILVSIAAISLAVSASAQRAGDFRRAAEPVPGEYIVVMSRTIPDVASAAQALATAHHGVAHSVVGNGIRAFGFRGNEESAVALARNPNVEWVEEVGVVQTSSIPSNCAWISNPYYPIGPLGYWNCYYQSLPAFEYWNLVRTTTSSANSDQNPEPYGTYSFAGTGYNVLAYVVDGGIRASHTEFEGRVIAGFDSTADANQATNPCNGSFSSTDYGVATHGTAVASVLGGKTAGAAKEVSLISVKVGRCTGGITSLDVVEGLDWVVGDYPNRGGKKAVLNWSLRLQVAELQASTCGSYGNCLSAVEAQIDEILQLDIVVVAAAGNQTRDATLDAVSRMGYGTPLSVPRHVITAGGTMSLSRPGGGYMDARYDCTADQNSDGVDDCDDSGIWYLNPGSNWGPAVSIWAPAVDVRVAHPFSTSYFRPGGPPSTGTSFAAPLVAGVVARIRETSPTLDREAVWNRLMSNSDYASVYNPDFDPTAVVNRRMVWGNPWE